MYLYHIKRKGMTLDHGYIGVSKNPQVRFNQHQAGDNPHLFNALNKYDDIELDIILECSEDYALWLENKLRPEKEIGWNIAVGGGMPPSTVGMVHSEEVRSKISKSVSKNHRYKGKHLTKTHRENISKGMGDVSGENAPRYDRKIYDFAHKEYGVISCTKFQLRSKFGLHSGCLSNLCNGGQSSHKGWKIL